MESSALIPPQEETAKRFAQVRKLFSVLLVNWKWLLLAGFLLSYSWRERFWRDPVALFTVPLLLFLLSLPFLDYYNFSFAAVVGGWLRMPSRKTNRTKSRNAPELHPALVKHSEFESVLLTVWLQSLVENSRSVTVAGRTFPVRSVTRHKLKEVYFQFKGHKFRGSEPYPNTESRVAEEREERKKMEFVEGGYLIGWVDNGRVYNGLYLMHLHD